MGFWESTLSSAIGSIIGILGAFIIAKWQMNKSQKLNNIPFYIQFNNALLYINNFNEKVEKIINIIEGEKRSKARFVLTKREYIDLQKCIELAIKELNSDITEIDFKNFIEGFAEYNKYAPVAYYKDLNFLFLSMAIVYNLILEDSKYLIKDLPDKIDIPIYNRRQSLLRFWLKIFRRKYKYVQRKFKI
jgi:hypothetical protein